MAQKENVGSRIIQTFNHFIQNYQANSVSCGVIICRADLNQGWVDKLKNHLEQEEQEVKVQVSYDRAEGMAGIILDGCSLGFTHYYSLHVKEYLENHDKLRGPILVNSFTKSREQSEQMLFSMIWELVESKATQHDIRIYSSQSGTEDWKPSILLVDSDDSIHQLLKSYFQRKGYIIHTAVDGKEGIEKYEQILPDLVITEINLSALNGYQFINQIRNIDTYTKGSSEIMVLTNKQLEHDIKRTFEYGVSEYITKPFSLIELEARIKKVLENKAEAVSE
ncbi:response regulator transcription factor [Halobacillus salinarum]|uniref:Response regulator transcription factor n=1 Tax=Halobacillus salinarum TaxID=2932257 RepID=A0ABY4EIN7_9BACI|nr:response regulator transcription factor [Halobacillus salinarum]UOQ43918.1 response regulator transcription factor [Halobacillus salinarum]